jgi:hypothetical protein
MIIGFLENHDADVDGTGYPSHGFKTFYFEPDSQQIVQKNSFMFPAPPNGSPVSTFSSMAIVRYDGKGYIVVAGIDRHLYAYSSNGARHWKSDSVYSGNTGYFATVINIADFNYDGIPEVYAGNRIFSLATGYLLCAGGSNNNTSILYHSRDDASITTDIVPRGNFKLCAGTQIYRVDIPQRATGPLEGTMSVITDMELPSAAVPTDASKDGATPAVDIDGALKIVVVTRKTASSGHVVVYVWKPLPGNASYLTGYYETSDYSDYYSIPMIGNIDGDSLPEIFYIGSPKHMYALDYLPGNPPGDWIDRKWEYSIYDNSECTGMTLFDFNSDGVAKIVYRDASRLYRVCILSAGR